MVNYIVCSKHKNNPYKALEICFNKCKKLDTCPDIARIYTVYGYVKQRRKTGTVKTNDLNWKTGVKDENERDKVSRVYD